jgi:hypothetical protein
MFWAKHKLKIIKIKNLSDTLKPNKAKSYLTGSSLSSFRKTLSNSDTAFASFCLRLRIPSFLATLPECTSSGQERIDGGIDFH